MALDQGSREVEIESLLRVLQFHRQLPVRGIESMDYGCS